MCRIGYSGYNRHVDEVFSSIGNIIGPISVASAIAVGASAVAALVPLLSSAGIFSFAWQWFVGGMGLLPKRKKTWGTVYDAHTKRPIPFARVQLLDKNKRVLETRIADQEGRYGFLTTPESLMAQNLQISIVSNASQYVFPSQSPATVDAFIYNNLYYGDVVIVNDAALINFDIPMDPVRPSNIPLVIASPSIALGAVTAALADAGFWLGLILVPLNFIMMPGPLTLGVLFLFLGTASLRIWNIQEHPFGLVVDGTTGKPIPFALITLNDLSGKRVAFTVSDERGRYFIVVTQGSYQMTAFTSAAIAPSRQVVQFIEARKGWITRRIIL
jgi:hypothetical protein